MKLIIRFSLINLYLTYHISTFIVLLTFFCYKLFKKYFRGKQSLRSVVYVVFGPPFEESFNAR